MISQSSIYGSILNKNTPPTIEDPVIQIKGTNNNKLSYFMMDESLLSKHMMLIGGTGCGKTNTFFHIVNQLKNNMKSNDVMIIFDTKGDYYNEFFDSQKDKVLSAVDKFDGQTVWNVFKDILSDGDDADSIEANVSEICWSLFSEAIEKNTSNPFFPNAARDLLASIITCIIRFTDGKKALIEKHLNNEFLREKLNSMTAQAIYSLLEDYEDQIAVMNYIGDGSNPQGLGVLAEMQAIVRKIFVGAFAKKGDFSIKEFVRNKGAKTLFIEYDIARGATLTPIYRLLIDLALKEAMSRKVDGNVYIFCDEFKLLPQLQHIDDAVNFGRSLGVKVFAGLQSIDQLKENYGEARANNLIAGFSSVLSFKANDEATRTFTSGLYGKNYVLDQYHKIGNNYEEKERLGNVVEDWEVSMLKVGEAIVGLCNNAPYKFRFDLYQNRRSCL